MVGSLLEYETVEAEEVRAILDGPPVRSDASGTRSLPRRDTPTERPAADEPQARRKADALSPENLAGTGMIARDRRRAVAMLALASSSLARAGGAAMRSRPARCRAAALTFSIPIRRSARRRSGCGSARPARATTTRRRASHDLAATAAAVAPLASGKSLYALVHTVGGELNIEVYPDIVGIGAVVPASAARRVVAAMTAAYFAPAVDDAAVKTARANAAVLGVQQRYESDTTLHDLLFGKSSRRSGALSAAADHGCAADEHFDGAGRALLRSALSASANAMLTLTGNVDASSIDAVTDGSGPGAMDAPFDSTLAPVRRRRRPRPVRSTAWAWPGSVRRSPMKRRRPRSISSPIISFASRPASCRKALDRARSDALVAGQFITLHDPGVMVVTIGGERRKAGRAARARARSSAAATAGRADVRRGARSVSLSRRRGYANAAAARRQSRLVYAPKATSSYAPGIRNGTYEQPARSLDPAVRRGHRSPISRKPVVVDLVATTPQKERPVKRRSRSRRSPRSRSRFRPICARARRVPFRRRASRAVAARRSCSQTDSAAALVGVDAGRSRRTRSPDDEAERPGGARRARRFCARRWPERRVAMPLEEAIAARGGSIRFTVDPGDVRFYVEALAADAPAVLDLFRSAIAAPDFSPATVRDARIALVRQIAQNQQVALQVGFDMLNAASSRAGQCRVARAGNARVARAVVLRRRARILSRVLSSRRRTRQRGGATRRARVAARSRRWPPRCPTARPSPVPVRVAGAERRVARNRRASRHRVAVADRAISGAEGRQPRFRADARAGGVHAAHALGHRASPGRRLADVRVALRRRGVRIRSRAGEPRAVRQWRADRQSEPRVRNGALRRRTCWPRRGCRARSKSSRPRRPAISPTMRRRWKRARGSRRFLARKVRRPISSIARSQAIAATTPADVQRVARTYLGNPTIALVLPRGTEITD